MPLVRSPPSRRRGRAARASRRRSRRRAARSRRGRTRSASSRASPAGSRSTTRRSYQGLKLEIDQINAKGGVGGKLKLQMITEDGKSDPGAGRRRRQRPDRPEGPVRDHAVRRRHRHPRRDEVPAGEDPGRDGLRLRLDVPAIVGDYAFINVFGTAALGAAQAEFAIKQGWKTASTCRRPSTSTARTSATCSRLASSSSAARSSARATTSSPIPTSAHRDADRVAQAGRRDVIDRAPRVDHLPEAASGGGLQGTRARRRLVRHAGDAGRRAPRSTTSGSRRTRAPRAEDGGVLRAHQEGDRQGTRRSHRLDRRRPRPADPGCAAQGRERRPTAVATRSRA